MVGRHYVPDTGDVVWMTFDPRAGHEQSGRRPAIVISPRDYNRKVQLALVCPITSQVKGYPFEVAISAGGVIVGAVLADHVKSLAWKARKVAFECKAPSGVVAEVRERLRPLLGY